MKLNPFPKSLFILIVFGYLYLYILEDIGNFISANLDGFKTSMAEHGDTNTRVTGTSPLKILRTPTDLLLEQQSSVFSDSELQTLKEQIAMVEYLMDGTEGTMIDRIDKEMLVYDNFYKKITYDIIMNRTKQTN